MSYKYKCKVCPPYVIHIPHSTTHLGNDVAQGVHDALLEVVEHETALLDATHHAREVVVQ